MADTVYSQEKLLGSNDSGIIPSKDSMGSASDSISCGSTPSSNDALPLKKAMGLVSGVGLIVGTMIGSGIFISPKGVLQGTGSVALSFIVWTGCGLIALSGALVYAELGTLITKCGAEYAYIMAAFSSINKRLGDVLAFEFAWVCVFIMKPALVGVIALSFGLYVTEPFFDKITGPPDMLVKLMAILCMMLVTYFNCHSLSLATKVQNIFTFTKLVALALLTVGGLVILVEKRGLSDALWEGFEDTEKSPALIALAFYDGLWAYDGWNNLNYVTEELKNPYKNLPRAVMIGIPLTIVCYVLTNVSYLAVLSKEELLSSNAVASSWGDIVLGSGAIIIPVAVAFSTFGAANGSCLTGGRLCYTAAREGHLPEFLSYIHIRRQTPIPSLLFSTLISCIMILPTDISALIDFFSFVAWIFYGLTMLSMLILRYTMPNAYRPYKCPIILCLFVLACSVYLIIGPVIQNPQIEFFYAFLFVISGLLFYFPFVYCRISIPGMGVFTKFVQLAFECVPSKYAPPE